MTGLFLLAATITIGEKNFLTYPFSDPDPVPATEMTRYPYWRYDGSSATGVTQAWQTVTLENDRIRVVMLPQVGGKVWGATDKVTGHDFLYANHVMKFRDIAQRGPWVSGGIEFNFGLIGHAPSSSTPVDWFVRTNADRSVSCFVSSAEYSTRAIWQVEVRLGADADCFETHTLWYNASGLPAPYYHWMNAGYSVRGNPEFLFPGRTVIGHQGEIESECWPFDAKHRRISRYLNNAFGGPKSYHVLPGDNSFYGIWWPELKFGSYHRNMSYEKFGRKLWLWALSREGGIWEDLLTDTDGQYAELQSGRCFNQERYDNYKTPFKHPTFSPGATETFTEQWGPVRSYKEIEKDVANAPEPISRPIRAPEDFDWTSSWGEYVRGEQYLRERHDQEAEDALKRAVVKDRFLAPAHVLLAEIALRKGDFKAVHDSARQALAINAYDAMANFVDGRAFFCERDFVTARDRLGVASLANEVRSAALALIARSYLVEGQRAKAAAAARKALVANALNLEAELALVVALRDSAEGVAAARSALETFPLFHAMRYELQKAGLASDFGAYVRNEIPVETYLELGYWYAETGCAADAEEMFRRAGRAPLALLARGRLAEAKAQPIAGVFPFRRESLPSLEHAVAADGHWKFRYLLAVLKMYFGETARARQLLESCGDEPDDPIFYQVRAKVRQGQAQIADLRRAESLKGGWRVARQLAEAYEAQGDLKQMLDVTRAAEKLYPTCNPIELAYARALMTNGQYRVCMKYMDGIRLLPSEHRDSGTDIYQTCERALGLPITWPETLGKGQPYPPEPAE